MQTWVVTPRYFPRDSIVLLICLDNSLVGDRINAYVFSTPGSILCKIPIEKAAVFPVPDWA